MGTHVVKTGLELTIMELRIMLMSEASASTSQELQLQVCPITSACVALLVKLCACVCCACLLNHILIPTSCSLVNSNFYLLNWIGEPNYLTSSDITKKKLLF